MLRKIFFLLVIVALIVFLFNFCSKELPGYKIKRRGIVQDYPVHKDKVALVRVEGPIFESEEKVDELAMFAEDEAVKAIVVRIDSPGGAVSPSEDIYNALMKARDKKPVICSFGTLAASGGYYIGSACHVIVSNKSTITGSIGVIANISTFGDLMGKIGIKNHTIKTGKYKDSGSPFREFGEEDRQYFADIANKLLGQFVDAVARGRSKSPNDIRKLAEGAKVYIGAEALQLGLVDQLGDLDDAIKVATERAGIGVDADVIEVVKDPGFFGSFVEQGSIKIFGKRFFIPNGAYYLFEYGL